ncbi:class I adenylate-forming enzyme family protein [Variovorax sp. dw_308]|uniref:class I adenylate-forming enzyme family protein n=1 Tax=Variovorax sp. dw_308 TaxID=2721546 RepID=UPI001C471F2E|nr:AMP-binding protein [Variovorax sp. dw_308]
MHANPFTASTLPQALERAASLHPQIEAWIDGDTAHSFADMHMASRRMASAMQDAGLARGDRIAVLSHNQIEWLQLFFAATRIGVAVVALSARYRDAEIEYMLADSEARMVFTLDKVDGFDCLAMFDRMAARLPALRQVIAIGSEAFRKMQSADADAARSQVDVALPSRLDPPQGTSQGRPGPGGVETATTTVQPDDLAMVIYTSGTTGRPKGCALTHASLLASAGGQARHTKARAGDLMQLSNPLNHVGGITCGILSQLLVGGSCELVASFKARTVLDMIRKRPPQILVGVPTMMTLILMHPESESVDLSSVRLIITGGSNVDSTLLSQLQQRMQGATIMNLYGLSEASGALVMTPWGCADEDLMQSIGKPLEGAEVRAVGADDHALPPGEIGELHFRGLGVVRDYIGAAAGSGAFEGGWLHTGDMGIVDARGYITLKGRMKDMYIQGGFNVYPAEVEAHIAKHPAVLMVAGIGVPDKVLGEVGRYYVIAREDSDLTEAEVLAHCAGQIADYKMPRQVVLRTELPMTPAGKIQKAALRAEGR